MNHYTINILKSDINYVIEAIRMRGYAIAEQIASQATEADQNETNLQHQRDKAKMEELQKEFDKMPWNVTVSEGGNIIAEQKPAKKRSRPSKKAAPFGLKKDGTPKSKPGRKTAA